MRTFTCPRCQARMSRENGPASGELLCADCAYLAAGNHKTAELAYQLGEHHHSQGQHDRAIAAFTEAIQLNPNQVSAYAGRANAYLATTDYPRAIHQYSEALRRGLTDANLYLNRGKCYFLLNDHRSAEADFTAAIRSEPQNVLAYRSRAYLYLLRKETSKAIADFTEAIRLEPRHALTYSQRGQVYHDRGEHDLAIGDVQRAIDLGWCDAKTYHLLGQSYFQKQLLDKAIPAFTEALRLDPKTVEPYSNRALCHLTLGNHDAALADLGVAAKLDPQSAEVRRRIAVVLDAREAGRKAAQQLEQQPPAIPPSEAAPLDGQPTPSPEQQNVTAVHISSDVDVQERGQRRKYFYRRDGIINGPYSSGELRQLIARGKLGPADEVWKHGHSVWKRAGDLEGLFTGQQPSRSPSHPKSGPGPSQPDEQRRKYFYRRKGVTYGPLSSQELRELAAVGELRPTDEVHKEGRGWKLAGEVEGLFTEGDS